MGPEQSLFITTNSKEERPFMFNIGVYLLLAACCLSCPLKTYIMKKTKLIPLNVTKVYFYDSTKPCPAPVPSNGNQVKIRFKVDGSLKLTAELTHYIAVNGSGSLLGVENRGLSPPGQESCPGVKTDNDKEGSHSPFFTYQSSKTVLQRNVNLGSRSEP